MLKHRIKKYIRYWKSKIRTSSQETNVMVFFGLLMGAIFLRILFLQVFQANAYQERLIDQHYTRSSLQADRGDIYVTDTSGEKVQLTNNVDLYTMYVDPKFIVDKDVFIDEVTPVIYDHLCVFFELEQPTPLECVQNLEKFTKKQILPQKKYIFYTSGSNTIDIDVAQEDQVYAEELEETLALATSGWVQEFIQDHLYEAIQIGVREKNYVGNFTDYPGLFEEFSTMDLEYLDVVDNSFLYVIPSKVSNRQEQTAANLLSRLLEKYTGEEYSVEYIKTSLLVPRENRYVRLVTGMNASLVDRITTLKKTYHQERLDEKKLSEFPRLHGIGFEQSQRRYYPYDTFMSHLVGYVDSSGDSYYGVEEYFNEILAGNDGKIVGLATPWIGQVGSNNIVVEKPKDGSDVYLTIDPIIQKELESLIQRYYGYFNADSIAVTVLDPHTGKVRSMVNYPTFNPNSFDTEYDLEPLTQDQRYLLEDDTRVEYPLYVLTGGEVKLATTEERADLSLGKYFFKNLIGPQVFVNKNISYPYEPGSVFKSLTLGIGVDSDSLSMYDIYNDPGVVQVGQFSIANIDGRCTGDNSFLHALAYSCNVGMVRIAQKMLKYVFYSYLEKLGFGQLTGIELANEEPGTLPDFNTVSKARFFNNTYGQGILTTPLQMAAAYASLVNGGRYIAPTIVENIYDKQKGRYLELAHKKKQKVFTSPTSDDMRKALVNVVTHGGLAEEVYLPGYSLGGKTGTSEIAYQGVYRKGEGWTNTSFVGIVTASDVNYVVAIQIRRPRSSQRGLDTAGRLFYQVAEFLIAYDQIER